VTLQATAEHRLGDAAGLAGEGLPRLLLGGRPARLGDHLARWGRLPTSRDLVEEVGRSGLRGRGGAGFPTAKKLAEVRRAGGRLMSRRRPVVVANGTESEPASLKDRALLESSPHLVLDGVVAAAEAVGADWGVMCVKHTARTTIAAVERALAERGTADPIPLELQAVPDGYVTGEASALVNWLTNGVAKPRIVPPHASERGVDGSPTLVDNVETLANMALIARFGAEWWRELGTADDPGSALATVSGAVTRPGVYEIPLGLPLANLLAWAGSLPPSAVLVGGYYGTWLTGEQAMSACLDRADLGRHGASLGCGVVAVLGADTCPLAEVVRVTRWLAGQSAGQCGPCTSGLPAVAGAVEAVRAGDRMGNAEHAARRWSSMVEGRGACKLPDGAVRFVRSALDVFSGHVELHRRLGPCRPSAPVLSVPAGYGAWQ
jgi:NADH:ubiquinone oxidoreductase subunit F (NADH-binding)